MSYIKPGKTFVLSKQTKRFMCTIVDPVARNDFKRAMIQAELAAAIQPKREPRKQAPGGNFTTHASGTVSSGG
jgi:hypothetical protein